MNEDFRYYGNSAQVPLCALLPGAVTAWQGKRAVVIETRERTLDGGSWAVVLDLGTGRPQHVGGSAKAWLPVFTDPYQVCSCHGDPWPCNDSWQATQAKDEQRRMASEQLEMCARCGQERNLGRVRGYGTDGQRRYCRRVACVQAATLWEASIAARYKREADERRSFAAMMQSALDGDGAA